MGGTIMGGKNAADTNKKKYGEDFYVIIGRRGGQNGTGHTFAHGKVDASAAGKIGGAIGKRGPVTAEKLKDAARRRAHKDFQVGFNEESAPWYHRIIGKR